MLTDRLDNCSDSGTHDAWPPDANRDKDADIGDVIMLFRDIIGVPANYQTRSDFDGDGDVDIGDVIIGFAYGRIGSNCGQQVQSEIVDAIEATEKYRDINVAIADGFLQVADYMPGRGALLLSNIRVDTVFKKVEPEGLIYKPGPDGWRLLGVFYLAPVWQNALPPADQPQRQTVVA